MAATLLPLVQVTQALSEVGPIQESRGAGRDPAKGTVLSAEASGCSAKTCPSGPVSAVRFDE